MDSVKFLTNILSRPDLEPFTIDQLQVCVIMTHQISPHVFIYQQGGFYILAVGLLASLVSMAAECRFGKRGRNDVST